MGNCLRNPRTILDPILMSDEAPNVALGQNRSLTTSPEVWTSDIPMTEGQLRGKRDTFWETAPAYDGRQEIWDALKAICEAAEGGDYALAQAIVDGANISLPTGRLVEAYDELGNRYILPKYCISRPTNMVGANSSPQRQNGANQGAENEDSQEADSMTNLLQDNASSSPTTIAAVPSSRSKASAQNRNKAKSKKKTKSSRHSSGNGHSSASSASIPPSGDPIVVKVRLSTMSKDIKMTLQASDRVIDVKSRLETEHEVPASRITMLYSGRVLSDRTYIKNLDVPKGFIIQAIVTSC